MTDHDPSRFSPDDEPLRHPDIPHIEAFSDGDNGTWLAVDIEPLRHNLIDTFAEHVMTVTKRYAHIKNPDAGQFIAYAHDVMELMESEESHIELIVGQWVILRGLDHYIYRGVPHPIPQGTTVCAQYIGVALSSHYKYDYDQQKMFEKLPLGVNFAAIGLRYVTDDGKFIVATEIPEDERVLLTLHGIDTRLSRLDHIEDEDEEDEDDEDEVSIASSWATYPKFNISGDYNPN